jgi:serine/threonine-protein kinase
LEITTDRILLGGVVEDPADIMLGERYKLLNRLGSGGMANVFRARDLNLQRDVAIKILREDLIEDPSFQARFLHEARSAANLSHPNIVTIYDFGHDQGRFYIVMEYVDGTDLKTVIKRLGMYSVDQAVELMIQIGKGVGYAHRAGLVHCDIKPQNILVSPDGRAKITDFGISRALASVNPDERSDVVWGSPKYFAPEQAAGNPPSPPSDVYALGVVFFEMLTGTLPFEAPTASELAKLHQSALPPTPREINPLIPSALEHILLKVLSKEPASRYRTADQFARVLTSFSDLQPEIDHSEPLDMAETSLYPIEPTVKASRFPQFQQLDWVAVILGLLAFLAVGGLIPLWLWVCLRYPACPF